MYQLRRRQRESGQTIILLALLLAILLIIAALVIDIGTMSVIGTEEHYVCDSASLAGLAETVATGSATAGIAKARAIAAEAGYTLGRNGVTLVTLEPYNADSQRFSETTSNRFRVTLQRTLPQYFASVIGITSTWVNRTATAAVLGTVPIDTSFGLLVGFPTTVNLAQFGPDARYDFGDCYSTLRLVDGTPNPRYSPTGYAYDLYIPPDLLAVTGSSRVRIEIFDADTINQGDAVNPSALRDTNGDPTEPEVGGLDEIRSRNGENLSGFTFAQCSTQTEYKIVDGTGRTVAVASYGPSANTPYYRQRQRPGSDPINTPGGGDHAQLAVDLKWITPQGFTFDTRSWSPPFKVYVKTIAGASENGYQLRMSTDRPSGQAYDPLTTGSTPMGALSIYGSGRVPINFSVSNVTKLPIGSVPSAAQQVVITNFDTDVGYRTLALSMTSFDHTQGKNYPVLFPAPPNASGANVVTDAQGRKYYTSQPGNLSGNGQFATTTLTMPAQVVVPETDARGNLLLDGSGRIIIRGSRDFEGGDIEITYQAGATDTSVWETSFQGPGLPAEQRIVLIR